MTTFLSPSRIIRCLLCLPLLVPSRAFALVLDGTTLTTTEPTTISEPVSLEASTIIDTDGVNDTISGVISGSGELTETGGGTLELSGSNTYTGGTTVEGGSTLEISNSSNLGSGSATLTLDNGTLETTSGVTLTENVSLNSGGGTINTDGANDTISGVISGSGGLTKGGSGTLTLSGDNTYTGPTVVEEGTLQAGVETDAFGNESSVTLADAAGVTLDLNNNNETIGSLSGGGTAGGNVTLGSGNLTVEEDTSTDFAGVISGSGELIKEGSGTLELSGSNTYTGGTVIKEGTLELGIDNALSSTGAVTVDASGTLDDNNHNETVAALVNNGTTEVGSGTLSVASYAGSGTLSINANSAGKLNATGNATLSGTALNVNLGSSFVPTNGNQSITLVTAGSVTGQFASVNQTAALSLAPTYTGTSATVNITEVPYLHTAGDPNQVEVATVLDKIRDSATGDLATVMGTLNTLNAGQLSAAFNQMTPAAISMFPQLSYVSENAQFSSLAHRFDAISSGLTTVAAGRPLAVLAYGGTDLTGLLDKGSQNTPWGFFASGNGSFGRLDSTTGPSGNIPGYNFNTDGVTFGLDYRINDWLTLGAASGYIDTHATSDLNGDTVENQSFKFGAYGVGHKDGWMTTGYIGGAHDINLTTRNLSIGGLGRVASGTPMGEEFNTRWGLSYDYKTRLAVIRPTAAIEYDRVTVDSFQESGAGALDLNVGQQTSESLRTELGGRLTQEYKVGNKTWAPYVSAAWQHEYENQSSAINAQLSSGGSTFSTVTPDAGRDTALLGAGTVFNLSENSSLFFNYIAEVGRANFSANNFDGGFRYRF